MHEVTSFLSPIDIFAVKLSSKALYNHIDEDMICLKHLLRTLIIDKNKEINRYKKTDFRLEYEITDKEVEKLINEQELLINQLCCEHKTSRERFKELINKGSKFSKQRCQNTIGNQSKHPNAKDNFKSTDQ